MLQLCNKLPSTHADLTSWCNSIPCSLYPCGTLHLFIYLRHFHVCVCLSCSLTYVICCFIPTVCTTLTSADVHCCACLGHTSQSSNVYVQCQCSLCTNKEPHVGLNTLEEQLEHVTGEDLPDSVEEANKVCRMYLFVRPPEDPNRRVSAQPFDL